MDSLIYKNFIQQNIVPYNLLKTYSFGTIV